MIRDTLRTLTGPQWARLIACAVAWAGMTFAAYCFVWSIGAALMRSI
jgi:hypothetical protein